MILRLDVPGGRVALADEGPRDAPVLVALHGFTGSRETWAPLARALADRWRVLRLDLPGHGETRLARHTFEACADTTTCILDALGIERASVLGYSMGGRLAFYLGLELRRVDALVVESASAGIESSAERAKRREEDEALAAGIESDAVEVFVARWEAGALFASQASLPEEARRALRRQRLANTAAGLAASLRGMGAGAQPWLGERLRELRLPVLWITGELDPRFTALARELSPRIAGARHVVVEGAGHASHLERPDAFARQVREFLEALPPRAPRGARA